MAFFVVTATDAEGTRSKRAEVHPQHRAHLDATPEGLTICTSGPFVNERGQSIGSLLIFESDDIESVRMFCNADPLATEGVWGSREIRRFDWKRGAQSD